jgi:hypothetical protein
MKFLKLALAALFLATQSIASFAQVYPVTTPVYIPSAVEQPTTCNTTCYVTFVVSGVSTVSFQLTNLTGTITASVQGTNEAPSVASNTWTTLNLTPFGGGSTVTSVSAIGMWTINTTGLTKVRVNVSALSTGPVTVNLVGASGGTVTFSSNSVVLTDVEANIAPGTAPAKQAVVGAVYNSVAPTLTNGQTAALQLNSSGQLITSTTNTEGVITAATAPPKMQVNGGVYNSAAPTLTNGQSAALQENASGQLIVANTNLEMGIAPGTAPAKAAAIGGVYNSTPPTLTNGQTAALQLDNDGSTYINLRDDTVVPLDPCQSRNVTKTSVFIAPSTATTTALVPVSGTTKVYVCGVSLVNGASQTAYIEYGTGTACVTGPTALTPTYGTSASVNIGFGGGTIITTPASNGLCLVTGGTTAAQALVSYVQQ